MTPKEIAANFSKESIQLALKILEKEQNGKPNTKNGVLQKA